MPASQRYKEELKKVKEQKVRTEQSLKCKVKCEELSVKPGVSADKNQDLSAISGATMLLRSVKEKEKHCRVLKLHRIWKRFNLFTTF